MTKQIMINVNGKRVGVAADPETPLLYVLRNDLSMNGAKFGCGLGQCGACTVNIDGAAARSCITPLSAVEDSMVVTLEGLGSPEKPHVLQQAFIDEQAVQCGYCINGMIMAANAFLQDNQKPTEEEIKSALSSNLCRCGTHTRIIKAVMRAARNWDTL